GGPRAGSSGRGRRRPRARRHHLDPQRYGLAKDLPRPADDGRRVPPARHDGRCSAAPPAGEGTGRTEAGPTMSTLIAPKLVSSRDQARELTAGLPDDLLGTVVVVDFLAPPAG